MSFHSRRLCHPLVMLTLLTCVQAQSRVTVSELRLVHDTWLDCDAGTLLSMQQLGGLEGDLHISYNGRWQFRAPEGRRVLLLGQDVQPEGAAGWVDVLAAPPGSLGAEPPVLWIRTTQGSLSRAVLEDGLLFLQTQHSGLDEFPQAVHELRARYLQGTFVLEWQNAAPAEVSVSETGLQSFELLGEGQGSFRWQAPADGRCWTFRVARRLADGGRAVPAFVPSRAASGLVFERLESAGLPSRLDRLPDTQQPLTREGGSAFTPFSFGGGGLLGDGRESDAGTQYVMPNHLGPAFDHPNTRLWLQEGRFGDFYGARIAEQLEDDARDGVELARGQGLAFSDRHGRPGKALPLAEELWLIAHTADYGPAPPGPGALLVSPAGGALHLRWPPVEGARAYRVYSLAGVGAVPRLQAEVVQPAMIVAAAAAPACWAVSAIAENGRESWPRFARTPDAAAELPGEARWQQERVVLRWGDHSRYGFSLRELDARGASLRSSLDGHPVATPVAILPGLAELCSRMDVHALFSDAANDNDWRPTPGAQRWLRNEDGSIALLECLDLDLECCRLRVSTLRSTAAEKRQLMAVADGLTPHPELIAELEEADLREVADFGPAALLWLAEKGVASETLDGCAEAIWLQRGWLFRDGELAFPEPAPGGLERIRFRVAGGQPDLPAQISFPIRLDADDGYVLELGGMFDSSIPLADPPFLALVEAIAERLPWQRQGGGLLGAGDRLGLAEQFNIEPDSLVVGGLPRACLRLDALVEGGNSASGTCSIWLDPRLPVLSLVRIEAHWREDGEPRWLELQRHGEDY